MTASFFSFFVSFAAVFGAVFVLRPIAKNVGLVDKPCSRKQHVGEIPLVGGLAIYVAITLCSFMLTPFDTHYKIYLLSTSFMVLIGALDDYHDIDARLRLIAQFLIGSLMVFGAGLYISNLGSLFGGETLNLGMWGPLFTVLAAATCINAFNMCDGVDGLIGVLSLNTFAAIGALVMLSNISVDLAITSMLIGAIFAFLFFNFGFFKNGRYKIFMGDSGSMLIGLTVIWLITYVTQSSEPAMRPITAVWIIAIPLMDMFSVMLRRILAGVSPFQPSRDHLHHLLLGNKFSNVQTTCIIGAISVVFSLIGIAAEVVQVADYVMLAAFIGLFVVYNRIVMGQDKKLNIR